jgi:hypothetical protein
MIGEATAKNETTLARALREEIAVLKCELEILRKANVVPLRDRNVA